MAENDALIKAWLIEANNPIRGTDQSGKDFWRRALTGWLQLLRGEPGAAAREQRGFDAMRKQWAKIVAGVMEFSSCVVQARLSKPTGIASHADLINCAEGLYCSSNIYSRIRGDHEDDVAKGKTTKRRKKQVSCPWAHYWEQLKDQDRFKSAAAAFASIQKKAADKQVKLAARAAAAAGVDGGGVAAEQQAADGDPAPAAAAKAAAGNNAGGAPAAVDVIDSDDEPWGDRPLGTKAAERARAENILDDRTIGRVASAVEKLGDATEQRTMMMAFSQPFMRETAMGAAYWAHQTQKMMAKEGIKVSRGEPAAAGGASGDAADGTGGAAPPPAGAAAGGSPVDDVSASGEAAVAEAIKVIAVDGDGDIFLVPSGNTHRAKSSGAAPAAADGASPASAAAEGASPSPASAATGSASTARVLSAAAAGSTKAPAAASSAPVAGRAAPTSGGTQSSTTPSASPAFAAAAAPPAAAAAAAAASSVRAAARGAAAATAPPWRPKRPMTTAAAISRARLEATRAAASRARPPAAAAALGASRALPLAAAAAASPALSPGAASSSTAAAAMPPRPAAGATAPAAATQVALTLRGRRAMATKLKNASAALASPLPSTIDMTEPSTEAAAAAATPSTSVVSAAAAALSVPAAAAAFTSGPAATARPPARAKQCRKRPPPSASSSDESTSDGGGFDGFDSDIIAKFARYGGRSSSESGNSDGSDSEASA